jgi:hypothetical protein
MLIMGRDFIKEFEIFIDTKLGKRLQSPHFIRALKLLFTKFTGRKFYFF